MSTHGLETKVQKIRGLDTAWLEGGNLNGPIMLFLHGFPDCPETFEFQFPKFYDEYHLVAPFSRGCYPSEKHRSTDRYGQFAQALDTIEILQLVDPSQLKKVIVVGHDLGAARAWFLAPMLGSRLEALITFNGLSIYQFARRYRDPRQILKSWYMYLLMVPVAPVWILRRFSGQLLNFAHRQGGLKDSKRPDFAKSLSGVVNPSRQYRAFLKDFIRTKREKQVKLKAPVLVIWGKDDAFLQVPKKSEFLKDAENVVIRLMPCNHWVHREKAESINDIVNEFLVSLGSKR